MGRLEPALGDQSAIGLVGRSVEKTGREEIHEDAWIDVSLGDERDSFAQRLDGGSKQKVSAEFDEIGRGGLGAEGKRLLPQDIEQRLAGSDCSGAACRADVEICGG